jgi:hypothetical protein
MEYSCSTQIFPRHSSQRGRHGTPPGTCNLFDARSYVVNGGVISDGADQVDLSGNVVTCVDRVLLGAKAISAPSCAIVSVSIPRQSRAL